jgi:hypothetical protein
VRLQRKINQTLSVCRRSVNRIPQEEIRRKKRGLATTPLVEKVWAAAAQFLLRCTEWIPLPEKGLATE